MRKLEVKMIRKENFLLNSVSGMVVDLPVPMNISYLWNFGSLLGMMLAIQILTGLVLSLHYQNGSIEAFDSVCHIHRDVNSGWFYRMVHFNGASGFFICVYLHVFRGLYYGSFMLKKVWTSGTVILLLLMATAFVGYVLPYGQMSFWGATVITNLISAVPYFGVDLVYWVWGGFAVGNATVLRFFVFHFLLPFVIALVVVSHLLFLHETGSSNPLGVSSDAMKLRFYPFYILKDLFGMVLFLMMFYFLVMLNPYFFGDCENFYLANPMSTPVHIKPEWYFLWAYAILRSVPSKVGGVVLLALSVMVLFIMVFFRNKFQGKFYYPFSQFWFWLFVVVVALLTWIGGCPAEEPYYSISQVLTVLYFSYYMLSPLVMSVWEVFLE